MDIDLWNAREGLLQQGREVTVRELSEALGGVYEDVLIENWLRAERFRSTYDKGSVYASTGDRVDQESQVDISIEDRAAIVRTLFPESQGEDFERRLNDLQATLSNTENAEKRREAFQAFLARKEGPEKQDEV